MCTEITPKFKAFCANKFLDDFTRTVLKFNLWFAGLVLAAAKLLWSGSHSVAWHCFPGVFLAGSHISSIHTVYMEVVFLRVSITILPSHISHHLHLFSALIQEHHKALASKVWWYVLKKIGNVLVFSVKFACTYFNLIFVCAACGRCVWSKIIDCTAYHAQYWLPNCKGTHILAHSL